MLEHDSLVPAGLRARLEVARLESLAVMRTLDRGLPLATLLPRGDVTALGEHDADCAEALWALDQQAGRLDVRKMVRDTLESLDRLPAVRQRLRDAVRAYPHEVEREILAGLDPAEAYSQVRGRDPATAPARRAAGPRVGRNDSCPCGSGRKYKKCCLLRPAGANAAAVPRAQVGATPRYHFVAGSYGGRGAFMPSIACEREQGEGGRALHFVLVKPKPAEGEDDAAAVAESDLAAAFSARAGEPVVPERVALHLRGAGYAAVDDPRIAADR